MPWFVFNLPGNRDSGVHLETRLKAHLEMVRKIRCTTDREMTTMRSLTTVVIIGCVSAFRQGNSQQTMFETALEYNALAPGVAPRHARRVPSLFSTEEVISYRGNFNIKVY